MTSAKTPGQNPPARSKTKTRRKRTPAPSYSAQEKVQAILAVWTERARPAEVCRQLAITWVSFSQWQDRAMEGMLQALEGRVNLASGQALSPRLQSLLQRRQPAALARLNNRLDQIRPTEVKTTAPVPGKANKPALSKEPLKESTS